MKQITNIRKAVCTMANELKKCGYSLSQAFRKAWNRVKATMTIRVVGTAAENRQERLQFLKQFSPEQLFITLECEESNMYDSNAVKVLIHIPVLRRYTVIGYVPKGLARELSKVLDSGIVVKAKLLQIIGGYSYKENLGVLLNIAI